MYIERRTTKTSAQSFASCRGQPFTRVSYLSILILHQTSLQAIVSSICGYYIIYYTRRFFYSFSFYWIKNIYIISSCIWSPWGHSNQRLWNGRNLHTLAHGPICNVASKRAHTTYIHKYNTQYNTYILYYIPLRLYVENAHL